MFSHSSLISSFVNNSVALLNQAEPVSLVREQNFIIKPFTSILGKVFDAIFNFVDGFMQNDQLGITIIIFTIVVRILILPFAAHSAKSMAKMRVIQPDIKKIQQKYKGKTDMEARQKMNAEVTELQRKNGVNQLNGCLPLLLQMPIIFALFEILRRSYFYIERLGNIYKEMAQIFLNIPNIGPAITEIVHNSPLLKVFVKKGATFDLSYADNCREVLSKLSEFEWSTILSKIPTEFVNQLTPLLHEKASIEYFFGINLVERPAFWPLSAISISIILPLLSGATTFLSSWLTNKAQGAPADDQMKMTQQMMLVTMPIMMMFIAFTLPAGLALYWTVGNIFQIAQQYVFNRMYSSDKITSSKEGK